MFIETKPTGNFGLAGRYFQDVYYNHVRNKTNTTPAWLDKLKEAIENCLNFTDRESYLKWVSDWKSDLNITVTRQRAVKKVTGAAHELEKISTGMGIPYIHSKAAIWQSEQSANRGIISALLLLRKEGKKKSQALKQQRLALAELTVEAQKLGMYESSKIA